MNSPVEIWRRHKTLHKYLGKRGKILTWTKIHIAPSGFEYMAPYIVGIIDFGKEKLALQIVDCDEVKTGMEVVTVVRKGGKPKPDGVIEYSLKVKPI